MSTHRESVDPMLDVLGHRHRRQLLAALSGREPSSDPPTDVASLVEVLAPEGHERRTRTELLHCHLPKLDDIGYVRWERESGTVTRGPAWPAIEPLLGLLLEHRTELPDDVV